MIKLTKAEGGTYRQVLQIDAHQLFSDVGTALGGDASAPDPHDLFDASLAACTAITLSMFAKRRGMALEKINVSLEHDNQREKHGEYQLAMGLEFIGQLSAQEQQSLLDIVEKCPIHKLMSHAKIQITTTQLGATQTGASETRST